MNEKIKRLIVVLSLIFIIIVINTMTLMASDNSIDVVGNVDFTTNSNLDIFNIGENNVNKLWGIRNLGVGNVEVKNIKIDVNSGNNTIDTEVKGIWNGNLVAGNFTAHDINLTLKNTTNFSTWGIEQRMGTFKVNNIIMNLTDTGTGELYGILNANGSNFGAKNIKIIGNIDGNFIGITNKWGNSKLSANDIFIDGTGKYYMVGIENLTANEIKNLNNVTINLNKKQNGGSTMTGLENSNSNFNADNINIILNNSNGTSKTTGINLGGQHTVSTIGNLNLDIKGSGVGDYAVGVNGHTSVNGNLNLIIKNENNTQSDKVTGITGKTVVNGDVFLKLVSGGQHGYGFMQRAELKGRNNLIEVSSHKDERVINGWLHLSTFYDDSLFADDSVTNIVMDAKTVGNNKLVYAISNYGKVELGKNAVLNINIDGQNSSIANTGTTKYQGGIFAILSNSGVSDLKEGSQTNIIVKGAEVNNNGYLGTVGIGGSINAVGDINVNILSKNGIGLRVAARNEKQIYTGNTIVNSNNGYALGLVDLFEGKSAEIRINPADGKKVQLAGDLKHFTTDDTLLSLIDVNFKTADSFLTGASLGVNSINNRKTKLNFENNSYWNVTSDSIVSDLSLNKGIINMSHKNDRQKIDIENILGNSGTFIMDISTNDINQQGGETDFLSIKNADYSQKHFIKIGSSSINALNNYDFDNKNSDNAIWISDTNTNVIFEGEEFESIGNIYNYALELDKNLRTDTNNSSNGDNWYITGLKKKENEVTETIEDDMTLYYMNAAMARIEMDTLHKRLGDIRNYDTEEGVWARVLSGQMEYDKSGYLKNNYTMVQAGYDKSKASENGIWFTGFGIHHRKGKIDFRNGDGENRSLGLSLYKSWAGYNGQYFDIIGKYSHIDNEYKSFNKINEKMEADYNTWSGSLSIEYGKKKWSDNKKWYIQPNTQLNYTYVNGQNYKTSSGVRAEQKNINSLIGKAGIYAGHEFEKSNHFIKVAILHEFMGDYGVDIKGKDAELRKRADGKDSWFEIGIGGDFKVGKTDSMNVYYEIERTYGSDFETNWQASIGIRYRFNKLSDLLPASSPKPVENPVIKYTMTGKNHFSFDESSLTEDGKKVIRKISEEIDKNSKRGILTIEGHTDSIGTTEYNQKLSEKRAESVEKEFKENLKTEIKYETKGYGKSRPVADNKIAEGRAKNRRVDIKFNEN
ncbi:outer membrane autotransporter barrel domain-containing protein [Fusobacterium ulcerans ATCC 49185]|uniref:Serine protease espP n=1 Tax=Fusobacterium ulcerans TaxID=861 RepID=A0AAX2JBM2_9FUSO|nr:autotransporter outer membrane beta-barrel domain-containing protein [Fusobacterium ulcerans]EFS26530.2 outer membrane autotransporter barrel domain-containing protein [Fusobacterium ulcerans ATCC 49185]SQJ02328.1 Serine protease espP precursor [Fusobacterium ulcerans]